MIGRVKELSYLTRYDSNADSSIYFFTHIILYSPIFPIMIFSNLDLIILIQKFLIEKNNAEKTSHHLNISDPYPFTNIAQIQYIFLDKTGTITKTNYKVTDIYFNNRLYKVDQERLFKRLKQMPLTQKTKFQKTPFQGVSTNGEILYASQNFGNTILDKSNKVSTANLSPQLRISTKPLLKINEIEEESFKYIFLFK